jgi:acetyltransferase-like isoleucine patch superfamily enzyme
MSSYCSEFELRELGIRDFGERVRLSRKASVYGAPNIALGNDVRIDDFCVMSAGAGGIEIGSYVHVAVYTSLIGRGKILLEDFSNVSGRVSIYSSSDDYSGQTMTNPVVPHEYTGVVHEDVTVGRHVVIGAGSVVLPGVILEQGVAIGALSLVKERCREFGIYCGIPAKLVAERKRNVLELERRLMREDSQ